MLSRVLLLLDPPSLEHQVVPWVQSLDVVCATARARRTFWAAVKRHTADLILVSEDLLPAPVRQSIDALTELPDGPEVVVLRTGDDPAEEARYLAAGVAAVVNQELPPDLFRDALLAVVRRVIARRSELADRRLAAQLVEDVPRLDDFQSASSAMQAFLQTVRRVTETDSTLLLLGESGVGKEHLARAIHAESHRRKGPFIAVNCGALPETLLDGELFGHEEGAFTGAVRARRGYFEMAHRGTILLDEIAELTPHLQVKLLRVLQQRRIQRLGGEEELSIDVRLMAATNRDLDAELTAGRFRQDLYYRLAVVTLDVPPLRERREDIRPLADRYCTHFAERFRRPPTSFHSEALDALERYRWPGNVRELINVIERAVLLAPGPEIRIADLPAAISAALGSSASGSAFPPPTGGAENGDWIHQPWKTVRRAVLDEAERAYLADLLKETRGRVGETAARAGITPRALSSKMRRLGLDKEAFR